MTELILDLRLSCRVNSGISKDALLKALADDSKQPTAIGSLVSGILERIATGEARGVFTWAVNEASPLSEPKLLPTTLEPLCQPPKAASESTTTASAPMPASNLPI